MLAQIYYYFFGLVAISGGAMGYARAKSKAQRKIGWRWATCRSRRQPAST